MLKRTSDTALTLANIRIASPVLLLVFAKTTLFPLIMSKEPPVGIVTPLTK